MIPSARAVVPGAPEDGLLSFILLCYTYTLSCTVRGSLIAKRDRISILLQFGSHVHEKQLKKRRLGSEVIIHVVERKKCIKDDNFVQPQSHIATHIIIFIPTLIKRQKDEYFSHNFNQTRCLYLMRNLIVRIMFYNTAYT